MQNVLFFFLAFLFFSCQSQVSNELVDIELEKINGVNLVSENELLNLNQITPLLNLKSNYAAVIPFSFMPAADSPKLTFDSKWQWIGEKVDGVDESIKILHQNGFKIMVKPQIWIGHGTFTGYIEMNSKKDWLIFEKAYQEYILTFAKLSEKYHVEILCIGTELNQFVTERPKFWKDLIAEIKSVYSGKLTYAENWDCYDKVPFWEQIDYIGIDAYFPLSDNAKPKKSELVESWFPIVEKLKDISEKENRPILFTEYGYRSMTFAAKKPWDFSIKGKIDEDTQVESLKALYESLWDKGFFAGGFLWKWHPNHSSAGGGSNSAFTVQNKKAEQIVRFQYSK